MTYNYNPTFHKDGSITYWRESHGWIHRVHPSRVDGRSIRGWSKQEKEKWAAAMLTRGFVKKNNKWVPVHSLTAV
jgi:hypothetical protein